MALFGSDIGQYVTPDGRQISLPSGLAAQFPGLQPFQPPVIPSAPTPEQFSPQDQADLTAFNAPPPAVDAPVTSPQQVPAEPQGAPRGPVALPAQQRDAGPANTAKPITTAQLQKMGNAGVANLELGAQEGERAAVERQGAALADQATAVGDKMAAEEEVAARLLEERRQAAEAQAAQLQSKTDEYFRNAKEIADTRVDRSVDHPILAALGVLLRGIGGAMQGKDGSDVMDPLYKAIDRKVNAQMQDLDRRRAGLALQKDALGMQREAGRDRLAELDTYRLAYLEQARRQIETIRQQTTSDVVRANTDVALAGVDTKKAQTIGNAQAREQQKMQQEAALREQQATRAESRRQADRAFNEQVRQFNVREDNDLKAAELAARAKGDEIKAKKIADAMKENETRGIGDPGNDGKRFLQPEGVALEKQAAAAEAEAQKFAQAAQSEKDPNKQAAMVTRARAEMAKANDLRAEIAINPNATWRLGSTEIADKMAVQIGATQTIADAADEINVMRDKHGAKWIFSTEGEAWMQSRGAQLSVALKDAWNLGVLSAQDFELIDNASGGDPTRLTPGDFIKVLGLVEGTESRLKSLVDGVEGQTRNNMRSRGFKGEYKVKRDISAKRTDEEKATIKTLASETPLEKAAQQERGVVGKAAEAILNPIGERPAERRARQAEESGSATHPGLSNTQASAVDVNLKAYAKGGDKAQRAASTLVSLATDSSRPALQNAMLATLKDKAPDLYRQALEKLPKQDAGGKTPVANQQDIARHAEAIGSLPSVALLQKLSIDGDPAARQELAKRAAAGDREAVKAIQEVISSRSAWRPTGAVR